MGVQTYIHNTHRAKMHNSSFHGVCQCEMSIRMKMSNFLPTYTIHFDVLLMMLLHFTISCSRQMALPHILCVLWRFICTHAALRAKVYCCAAIIFTYLVMLLLPLLATFRAHRYYCSLLKIRVVPCLKYTSNHIFECSAEGIQQFASSFFT